VEPTILHADADAFFAAVAQRDDPELRGKPVVVGSWVVMAASYEARRYGIRGGMGAAKARRLCPHLLMADVDFDAYTEASRQLFEVFRETSPVVEGLSLEEAFLDVSGLGHIRERVGLAVTVGVASSKVVAKMASREAKPDGLKVVEPGRERHFLHPIPVEELWGVGKGTAPKLHAAGITTVGALARRSVGELASLLGPAQARQLHALANCRDLRRVRKGRARRSFGTQSALGGRERSPGELDSILVRLVDRVTGRMRAKNRQGRTVILRLRFRDYKRATRSRTLPYPTAASKTVLASARALMAEAMPTIRERGVTMVGVALTNIEGGKGVQLELPLEPPYRPPLDAVLDEVRERFGSGVLRRASGMDSRLRREGGAGLG
jgi:DNA polymerase IV